MGTNLPASYSGIVLNQNASTPSSFAWRSFYGGGWVYETFYLPADYALAGEALPDLSGFQLLVSIDAGFALSAGLDYTIDWYTFGGGWNNLATGTVVGSHTDGNCWFDVILPSSAPIPVAVSDLPTTLFRIGAATRTAAESGSPTLTPVTGVSGNTYSIGDSSFTVNLTDGVPVSIDLGGVPSFLLLTDTQVYYGSQEGISALWYAEPNPLAQNTVFPSGLSTLDQLLAQYPQAFQSDNATPLLDPVGMDFTQVALNFRILALVADSGTDFLGNEYRSFVTQAAPANTDTTAGLIPVAGSGQSAAWQSPPLPSRFAVTSLYFDMTNSSSATTLFGITNLANNPSFEWDALNATPAWWSSLVSEGMVGTFKVEGGWAGGGIQSLRVTGTSMTVSTIEPSTLNFFGVAGTIHAIPSLIVPTVDQSNILTNAGYIEATSAAVTVAPGSTYSLQATCDNLQGQPYLAINWLTSGASLISQSLTTGNSSPGVQLLEVVDVVAPPNAVGAVLVLGNTAVTSTCDSYWDGIMFTQTSGILPYDDGDSVGWEWTGAAGNSPSAQIITQSATTSDSQVIDGINVDPSTPNMAFNVYYSQDDAYNGPTMTETDWESKLWTRVPMVYTATQAQTYAFPQPIVAKYIKVEFTNLQSQNYDAGNFVLPISYKRFPMWVANFFILQMSIEPFAASQVNVQYDALDFAYNYYLDDLSQEPAAPVVAPTSAVAQLTNYFTANNSQFQIDATTLAQINLNMYTYASPAAAVASPGSLLSSLAASVVNAPNASNTSEAQSIPPVDYSVVSTSNRDQLVFEQALPVMYFFVTCRHAYQELSATLQYNRAYFAGVNSIAFIRNNYTIAADTPLYIEPGGDSINTLRTDFILGGDGNWYTYEDSP